MIEDGAGPGDRTVTRDLQPLAVKGRNKAFLGGAALLHKALFYADFVGEVQNFFIFCGDNPAVDFRKGSDLGKRGVLVHNADENVVVIGVMEVAQNFLGICGLSREQQVADDDTPLKQAAFCIKNGSPCLAEHFRKSGGGLFKKDLRRFVRFVRASRLHAGSRPHYRMGLSSFWVSMPCFSA